MSRKTMPIWDGEIGRYGEQVLLFDEPTRPAKRVRKIASPEWMTRTTPLRLDMAAQLAFPDGSMGVAGLRKEIDRGNLPAAKIAGRLYVTLDGIEEMKTKCAITKVRSSTCATPSGPADNAAGSSSTGTPTAGDAKSAQAFLNQIAQRLRSSSPNTSPPNTSQTLAVVLPIKS